MSSDLQQVAQEFLYERGSHARMDLRAEIDQWLSEKYSGPMVRANLTRPGSSFEDLRNDNDEQEAQKYYKAFCSASRVADIVERMIQPPPPPPPAIPEGPQQADFDLERLKALSVEEYAAQREALGIGAKRDNGIFFA